MSDDGRQKAEGRRQKAEDRIRNVEHSFDRLRINSTSNIQWRSKNEFKTNHN